MRKILSLPTPVLGFLFSAVGLLLCLPLFAYLHWEATPPEAPPTAPPPTVVTTPPVSSQQPAQDLAEIARRDAEATKLAEQKQREEAAKSATGWKRIALNMLQDKPTPPKASHEDKPAPKPEPPRVAEPETPKAPAPSVASRESSSDSPSSSPSSRERRLARYRSYNANHRSPAPDPSYTTGVMGGSPIPGSGVCGAPTRDGTPCMRRVRGGGLCYQHGG